MLVDDAQNRHLDYIDREMTEMGLWNVDYLEKHYVKESDMPVTTTTTTSASTTTTAETTTTSVTTTTEKAVSKGDANGDGSLNLKDVVLIRRYIAGGWGVTIK